MVKALLQTISLFCVLILLHSGASGSTEDKRLSFTVPAAPWTMTLPADDFAVRQERIKPDGKAGYFYIVDEKQHINLSFYIEPVGKCTTSKACRDLVWKSGNPNWEKPQDVVMSEIGEVSIFEFMIPSFKGQPIQQQNMYAQFVVDGFWVDLHLSKVLYEAQDRKLFERLIKAIRFEPKKNA